MGHDESHQTLLQGVIKAFRLKRTEIVRMAERLSRQLGVPAISRYHLWRLERGYGEVKQHRILIVVSAIRALTGVAFRAGDLFRLEPAGAGELLDRSNLSVPIISGGDRMSRAWRVFVPEDSGSSPDESFEKLYAEYGALLRGVAIRRYGIPIEDAEEIVQEAFISYLQRCTAYLIRDTKGWLYGTVRHRSIDYLRARGREVPLEAVHEETADERPDIARDKLIRELTFSAVIARLGEKCRETLRRRFFKGEDRNEIASGLSTTPGNVDQLISTCRRLAAETFRNLISRNK